jgi:HTH-type transcriptional regulator, glycine betaine synthesis regulator
MIDALERSKALFIRRWGEMSGYWGINRTMAELHALLYISAEPLNTDEIMAALQISRGNASMNIRQLVNWGLVDRVHKKADRKEYFSAQTGVWEMFESIVRERRRREVEPIIETISRCRQLVAESLPSLRDDQRQEAKVYRERLENMADFLTLINGLVNVLLASGQGGLGQMQKSLGKGGVK